MDTFIAQLTSGSPFIFPNKERLDSFTFVCAHLFSLAKEIEPVDLSPMDTLLVETTDVCQVWEQLQLMNMPFLGFMAGECEKLLVDSMNPQRDSESASEQNNGESEDGESGSDQEEEVEAPVKMTKAQKKRVSINQPLNVKLASQKKSKHESKQESEEESEVFSSESDDGLEMNSDNDNANDIRYEDFFGKDGQKSLTFEEFYEQVEKDEGDEVSGGESDYHGESDDEEELEEEHEEQQSDDDMDIDTTPVDPSVKSSFERKQQQMDTIVRALEEEAIKDKHWVLKGEASSKVRPVNSLLEEDLEVDYTKRPAPIITEENTKSLEDIIKQRILDDLFDDVERKQPPKERNFDPNRKINLDDSRSKISLAQVYENEYNKQLQGIAHKTDKDILLEKTHAEIDVLFNTVCSNLDALSNWHFTPKELHVELEVLPTITVPAISMEEAQPGAENVNTTSILAPKEIYDGKVQKADAEKDASDKRKERNTRKTVFKKRKIEHAQVEKDKEARVETDPNAQKTKAVKELLKDRNVTFIDDKKNGGKGDKKGKLDRNGAKSMRQGDKIGEHKADGKTSNAFRL